MDKVIKNSKAQLRFFKSGKSAVMAASLVMVPLCSSFAMVQAHESGVAKQQSDAGTAMPKMSQGGMSMDGKAMSRGSKDMHESMMMGMKDMDAMSMSGDTDQDFAMMMKKHHQGAVDMAKIELKHGKDAELKGMAQKIVDSQQTEIKQFEQWQETHK